MLRNGGQKMWIEVNFNTYASVKDIVSKYKM